MRLCTNLSKTLPEDGATAKSQQYFNFLFQSQFMYQCYCNKLRQCGKNVWKNDFLIKTNNGCAKICAEASNSFVEVSSMPIVFPLSGFVKRIHNFTAVQCCEKIHPSIFGVLVVNVSRYIEPKYFCSLTLIEESYLFKTSVQPLPFLIKTPEVFFNFGMAEDSSSPLTFVNCLKKERLFFSKKLSVC